MPIQKKAGSFPAQRTRTRKTEINRRSDDKYFQNMARILAKKEREEDNLRLKRKIRKQRTKLDKMADKLDINYFPGYDFYRRSND